MKGLEGMRDSTRVDVLLTGTSMGNLMPTPTSMVHAGAAAYVISICCLRRPGQPRVEVAIAVDEPTAKRFVAACRLQSIWERRVIPVVLATAALACVTGIIAAAREDSGLGTTAFLVIGCLAIAVVLGRLALGLQRSSHHPRLVGRDTVRVCDVDREAALAWLDLNPGVMTILG